MHRKEKYDSRELLLLNGDEHINVFYHLLLVSFVALYSKGILSIRTFVYGCVLHERSKILLSIHSQMCIKFSKHD